jgi:hypothetical protein
MIKKYIYLPGLYQWRYPFLKMPFLQAISKDAREEEIIIFIGAVLTAVL